VACPAFPGTGSTRESLHHIPADGKTGWGQQAFPVYLHDLSRRPFPGCEEDAHITSDGRWPREAAIWQQIRQEAEADALSEPLLASFLQTSILSHDSFEKSLAFVLANRMGNTVLLPTQLFETFFDVLTKDADVRCGALADMEAMRERDPACLTLVQPLLYAKGYHAIQTHRIAHHLWKRGHPLIALALQSWSSEVFAVDIHPAARIGKGILLDHGTGVVIGETAVVGDNCSLLQNITLGGTGKDMGDRHPKIGNNVLIGANATVLGNIKIGNGSQIAAGSLVLKSVGPCTMVAGSPAREVGRVARNPAASMEQWQQDCLPCSDELAAASAHLPPAQQPECSPCSDEHAPQTAKAQGPPAAQPLHVQPVSHTPPVRAAPQAIQPVVPPKSSPSPLPPTVVYPFSNLPAVDEALKSGDGI